MKGRSGFWYFILVGALIPALWWVVDHISNLGATTLGNIIKLLTWPSALLFLSDPGGTQPDLFAIAALGNVIFFAVLGALYWICRNKFGRGMWPVMLALVLAESLLVALILGWVQV